MSRKSLVILTLFLVFGSLAALVFTPTRTQPTTETLPARLSDTEFWNMVTSFSEPGGFFRSDNFVSNETTFQYVIPDLQKKTKRGGVYLGVGPDQNFTYISAIRPKMAFIVDIRRQNMLLHLMYKAIFELSANRGEFLSRLFSRPLPGDIPVDSPPGRFFSALATVPSDPELTSKNLQEIFDHLQQHHKFFLNVEDLRGIEYVYSSFVSAGPEIRYSFPSQYNQRRFPTYAELMRDYNDGAGRNHTYMESEENFQVVKQLQKDNRLIPLVGDFAGEDALTAVGQYLADHGATVTAFYTSNVEFYLYQSDDWKRFYYNVADLPLDEKSVFIRAIFNNNDRFVQIPINGARSMTFLDSMMDVASEFRRGRLRSYRQLTARSQ